MKGIPTVGMKRLKRAAVLTGVGALIASASVLGALGTTQAHAATPTTILGNGAGDLGVSPTTGPTSGAVTYSANACPAGVQGSADLILIDPSDQTDQDLLGNPVVGTAAAFSFATSGDLGAAITGGFVQNLKGNTVEVAVQCWSGAGSSGTSQYTQDAFLAISADGSTYTKVAAPTGPSGPANTTTTLTASSPAYAGQNITLMATVAGGTTTPAGSVTFTNGSTAISGGTNVPLVNGVATFTTQFAAAGTESLEADYTSNDTTTWANSSGTDSLSVTTAPTNAIPLTVTVPTEGSFTLTVGTTSIALTPDSTGLNATGTIPNGQVKVTDTRNSYPGWVVSGQDSAWTGSGTAAGGTFSGNQLGWTPTLGTTVATGVTKGTAVTAAAPGLGSAAVLAQVAHGSPNGFGESDLGAGLDLIIPASAPAGPYASSLTITAVTTN